MKLALALLTTLPLMLHAPEMRLAEEPAAKSMLLEKAVADFNNKWDPNGLMLTNQGSILKRSVLRY